MGAQKPKSIKPENAWCSPLKGGTSTGWLAPPWARRQVQWLGKGYYVVRLATEEASRWVLGASFPWNHTLPHEKTFRRAAIDKSEVIKKLRMNPWPVHLAGTMDYANWRDRLSELTSSVSPVFDTGHVTMWQLSSLGEGFPVPSQITVLDGHHSRKAQRHLGLERLFGWLEPMGAPQLHVGAIHRAGWAAAWLERQLESGELKKISSAPSVEKWLAESSLVFEVVHAHRRWWCEVVRPEKDEGVVDALTRLARRQTFLRAGSNFEEMLGWLERAEVDTVFRLPPPTKAYVEIRAASGLLFPQKSTYFHPKIPFGTLVADLS